MKIGFTNGCFDVFHPGHDYYLRQCLRGCDYLIVALNSDRYCREVKGEGRPVWTWGRRMKFVRTLASAVIPFEGRWDRLVLEMHPQVVFQGEEYRGPERMFLKTEHVTDLIQIVYIPRLPGYSTSAEIERCGLQKEPVEHKTAPP